MKNFRVTAIILAMLLALVLFVACQSGDGGKTDSKDQKPAQVTKADKGNDAKVKQGKQPKIQLAKNEIDMGQVSQGETAKTTIIVKNIGDGVLHIKRAKGS